MTAVDLRSLNADNRPMLRGPATSALTVILFGLTGMLVLATAGKWANLARERERPDERPVIPVHSFRAAAALTCAALVMVGLPLLWSALLALP
jgi:hypothetical protein